MTLEGELLGIYRVGPELGRGGMGTVYRAESVADGAAGPAGTAVALKVFHPELVADERAFRRFQLEAEIGKEIRHDHLVRTYELSSGDVDGAPHHFMVMDVIEGKTLKALLEELGTFPEHLLYQVTDQILGALQAIHERDVVHRDIKPENIVITADHRVLLMDLGVARREAGRELTQSGEFIGSLSYAPPEQFTQTEVGPRADLYALGVSLYELATGANPFGESSVEAVMRSKLQEELAPPRSLDEDLDAFWNEVIATCVRREPADRFASAAELRQILRAGEASDWWRRRSAGKIVPSAEHALKRLRVERRTPLFARAVELEQLKETGERAQASGAILLIGGPSGVGKSRLLYDYLESVAGAGGPVLAAGRAAGAGSVGYGPFIEALGDLLAARDVDQAALENRLHELLPDTAGIVAPLAEFLRGNLQPGPDTGLSKDALFAAALRILRAIAADRPLVLAVEDLHLAGPETVELFAHLARGVPDHAVFLIGVYAADELGEDAPLVDLIRGDTVENLLLQNLRDVHTEALVRFVVGHERTVRALGPTLQERSEGNPLIVLEVLAHLTAGEQLREKDGGLELAGDVDELAVPSTVRDLVGLKLATLDDEERETLEAAAVIGPEFDASLLAEVLEEKLFELAQRLAGLERRHRLLAGAGKDRFKFANRQLFEAIYDDITPALRTEYHDLIADTLLEASDGGPKGERAYSLLRHLFHAERTPEAEPFLEPALDHIAKNFHANYAAPFLEKVTESLAAAAPKSRFALAMRLWAFYDLLASRADQLRVLELAGEMADGIGEPGARARVHALRAGSYWVAGDNDRAQAEAEAGLGLAREARDSMWEATCNHTLGVVAFRRGEYEAGATYWRAALASRREIGDRRGEASTLQALALVMPAVGEGDRVLATMQESLAVWREIGERRGEASMLMNLGNRLVDEARYDEGLDHIQQAIERHRETGALINEALCLTNLGRAQAILGRIDDARDSWQHALRLFIDLGNPNGELAARTMLGDSIGEYGEHEEARGHLTTALELAERTGNRIKVAMAHRQLGSLLHRIGEREQGVEHLEQALAIENELNDRSVRALTLEAIGLAALDRADYEEATRVLEEALPDAGSNATLILCRLARAHREAGRRPEAKAHARQVLERIEAAPLSPQEAPEIHYTLYLVLGDETFLARAKEMAEARARQVRNDSFREYYLTRTWPNAEMFG